MNDSTFRVPETVASQPLSSGGWCRPLMSLAMTGLVLVGAWQSWAGNRVTQVVKLEQRAPVRFAVLSDLHFYDARLGTTGQAFEDYLNQDPKLLKESEAILDAALQTVVGQQVRFVIIPGDLTKDGELVNHVRVAQHLAKLEQSGVKVFVIPGNHDINNSDAVMYLGDSTRPVPNASPATFRAIYQRFGYGEAVARDPNSLSYVAEPVPGLWLLGIDSCKYEESARLGFPVVSGRIKPETMEWIQAQLGQAAARGIEVIGFMHHGVNQHFLGEAQVFPDYLVDDWPTVSAQLAAAGLRTLFTGHYHSQDAAYALDAAGHPVPTLCDIETGSLVMYPCAFRIATLDAEGILTIQSQRVTEINMDTGGLPFEQYAAAFLAARLPALATYQLMSLFQVPQAQAEQVAPLVAQALMANYAGDEMPSPNTQATLNYLLGSPEPMHTLGMMLWGLWADLPPGDNQLSVPVRGN